jgi:serine protease inhibitor
MDRNVSASNNQERVVFDADHPFLFTINQKETNTILFMGNVENPLE